MKHIYIVRHGQSTANAEVEGLTSPKGIYVIDSKFSLTEKGKVQAYKAGENIAKLIQNTEKTSCNMYISPYERTRQTAEQIEKAFKTNNIEVKKKLEDPRIIEQDFGDFDFQCRANWKDISPHSYKINQARYHDPVGRFFARLENGENLLDVYNRVSLFVTTRLERDLRTWIENFVIVTHGNTMRVMKMFLLDMKVEAFEEMRLMENATGFHIGFNDNIGVYSDLGEL